MSEHDDRDAAPARPLFDRVQQLLRVRNMTMSELAKRARVGRATIYNWQTNKGAPDDKTVLAVARAIGLDPDEALKLAGLPPLPEIDASWAPGLGTGQPVDVLADLPEEPVERAAELRRRLDVLNAEVQALLGDEQGRRRTS